MQAVVSTSLSEFLRTVRQEFRISTGFSSAGIHPFPRKCFPNTARICSRRTYIHDSDVHCRTYCDRHSRRRSDVPHGGGQGAPATRRPGAAAASRRGRGWEESADPAGSSGNERTRRVGRNDTGADVPGGTSAPRLLRHSLRGPGCLGQNPAARSCSRSRSTAAGECSERLPLSRTGMSWRWRARVRLATMAATATRLTPKVRISRLRVGGLNGAPLGASRAI